MLGGFRFLPRWVGKAAKVFHKYFICGPPTVYTYTFWKGVWPAISQFCLRFIHAELYAASGEPHAPDLSGELATKNSMINVRWQSCWIGRVANGLERRMSMVMAIGNVDLLPAHNPYRQRHQCWRHQLTMTSAYFKSYLIYWIYEVIEHYAWPNRISRFGHRIFI